MRDAMQCPMLAARIYLKRRWRRFGSRLCRRVRPHEFARSHEAAAFAEPDPVAVDLHPPKIGWTPDGLSLFSERDFPSISCGAYSTRPALEGQVPARRGAPDNLGAKLPAENDQLIPRSRQFSDADRIPAKHLSRDLGWIIAGTQNDDFSARELLQQTLKIAVSRDQDETMCCSVFQNPPIANTGKPISKRAFRFREQVA